MAINCKTFIEKSNTIIKDSNANTGLNPVLELNYGNMLTRILIYFNHEKIKKLIEDKTYPDINKLHHVLHMTNASSIQSRYINEACVDSQYNNYKERASSFDLIFFILDLPSSSAIRRVVVTLIPDIAKVVVITCMLIIS